MLKFEAARKIFANLLDHPYVTVEVDLLNGWKLSAEVASRQSDTEAPYLGSLHVPVTFRKEHEEPINFFIQVQFIRNKGIPSLEDQDDQRGGYAISIRSSKSELLYRAMQAARYEIQDDDMTVHMTTDLNSKKGDESFRHQMLRYIQHFLLFFQQLGGKRLGENQFLFATYNSTNDAFTQEQQGIFEMLLLLSVFKAIIKEELKLPISALIPEKNEDLPSAIWKVAPGKRAAFWADALEDGNIFIGWPELGDLRQYNDQTQLKAAYFAAYNNEQEPRNDMESIWSFYREIKPGDIVFANQGMKNFVGIGRVTGEYSHDPDFEDYPNTRSVEWIVTTPVQLNSNAFRVPTVTRVEQRFLEEIKHAILEQVVDGSVLWEQLFGLNPRQPRIQLSNNSLSENFHLYLRSRQFWFSFEFVSRFVTALQAKPFVILSGASGTGKTKIAQYFAEYMKDTAYAQSPEVDSKFKPPARPLLGDTFHIELRPYTFDYQRMMVTVEMQDRIDMDLTSGTEIEVRFGGQSERSLIKSQGNAVRLGFRKNFMTWLHAECKISDQLQLTIADGGRTFHFQKETSPEILAPDASNAAFVSVRPDWLDNRGMLGYYNPITETYEPTSFLLTMLRAERHPDQPYFVLLDEMNLAKVEYYFSDYLSCLESRRMDGDRLVQESLFLHQQARPIEYADDQNRVWYIPAKLAIPQNLYVIGTVNIDETTYMFSPKVLDRANVLECGETNLSGYWHTRSDRGDFSTAWTPLRNRQVLFTQDGQYHLPLYRKDFLKTENRLILKAAVEEVLNLHRLLEEHGYAFGYRVFDEVMSYLLLRLRTDEELLTEALDAQVVQKMLPKLHGNRKQIEGLLLNLLEKFVGGSINGDPLSKENREKLETDDSYIYPLSGAKVYRMYRQLIQTGYSSFIC
ncbi:hypothetical protein [Cohnella yongneupensis]|uniref:ATPase dynein-related AAA domain-containing protein n=1 Tax=Cohnella yongneupensis TaxID=425006 RepID=A0ABW0R242_9BACL